MKNILFIFVILFLSGCRSTIYNAAFEQLGIYNDSIVLEKVSNGSKEIIFFPMHHVATELFYIDVHNKIDSLLKLDYIFYKEMISPENINDKILIIKAAKFQGFPHNENGYTGSIESILMEKFNFKPKKELLNQPNYLDLSLDDSNSIYTDPSLQVY